MIVSKMNRNRGSTFPSYIFSTRVYLVQPRALLIAHSENEQENDALHSFTAEVPTTSAWTYYYIHCGYPEHATFTVVNGPVRSRRI
jgi:hypothetical protein